MKDMYLFTRNFGGFRKGQKVSAIEKPLADELKRKNVIEEVQTDPEAGKPESEKPKKSKKK